MDATGGWTITLACPCGRRATYRAVLPSLAADAAEGDGWTLARAGLGAPGERPATCRGCAPQALRAVV